MAAAKPDTLLALAETVVALFHRLRAAANDVHGTGELTAARRGVLRGLSVGGPQTVPQMARARPVSRQHIQALVNALIDDGLVGLRPNPAHKRSHLVALTEAGAEAVSAMDARERAILREADLDVTEVEAEAALDVLTRLKAALDSPAWRDSVARDTAGRTSREGVYR